jgi:hypothetical protein
MNETTIRNVLQQAMAGQEPPIGQGILGGAVRAARVARRRRFVTGVVAVAAAVPALAFGVPALAGALSPTAAAAHGGSFAPGSAQGGARHHASSPRRHAIRKVHGQQRVVKPMLIRLVRPVLRGGSLGTNPVPITNKSFGQLMIDDMPAGAHLSQIEANVNAGALWNSHYRDAAAWFENVVTAAGGGEIQANLLDDTTGYFGSMCPSGSTGGDQCASYNLPGGVIVVEDYAADSLFVTVFRPGVGNFTINESNSAMRGGSPTNTNMPLTVAQMVRAAMDPRWQFAISQSFVQQASKLHVAPLNMNGS